MTPGPQQITPLDQMLGLMLETWNNRYAFNVDRGARKAEFTRGDFTVRAEEAEDGMIRVSLTHDGKLFTKVGKPIDCAKEIEVLLFSEAGSPPNSVRPQAPSRPWWKFWS
jgi:hypothetical protein